MHRPFLLGLLVALASSCSSDGTKEAPLPLSDVKTVTNAIEAAAVPEVTEIPTEEFALEQAEAEVTSENADDIYQDLLSEIQAELGEQP